MSTLLVAVDDGRLGAVSIEGSAALAARRQLALEIVHAESPSALRAAALPFAQVLAHAASVWQAFAPPDVERGFRAQALRIHALAEGAAARHGVSWSMRRVRAALPDAAMALLPQASLLLFGPAAATATVPRRLHDVTVVIIDDDPELQQRCRDAARDLAASLAAIVHPLPAAAGEWAREAGDLLVLPRRLATRRLLAAAHVPLLLVA